jgi:hypothetical protein
MQKSFEYDVTRLSQGYRYQKGANIVYANANPNVNLYMNRRSHLHLLLVPMMMLTRLAAAMRCSERRSFEDLIDPICVIAQTPAGLHLVRLSEPSCASCHAWVHVQHPKLSQPLINFFATPIICQRPQASIANASNTCD